VRKWLLFVLWVDANIFLQHWQSITISIFFLLIHQFEMMAGNEKPFSCFALPLHPQL